MIRLLAGRAHCFTTLSGSRRHRAILRKQRPGLNLPFSHDAFLDVFGAYNAALWPVVWLLWAATAAPIWVLVRRGRLTGRAGLLLLAVHWAWSGAVYHWGFFRAINPAALTFGIAFVVQALAFVWLVLTGCGRFYLGWTLRGIVGGGFVVYGMAYPAIGLTLGLEYPRLPLFAVPCPTTLVTTGMLVVSAGLPREVYFVPVLWAVIGSSAAFALGIRADLALVAAAVVLALDAIAPRALGPRDRMPAARESQEFA